MRGRADSQASTWLQVLRIADLSRTASRNNLAKADRATNLAKQVRCMLLLCMAPFCTPLFCCPGFFPVPLRGPAPMRLPPRPQRRSRGRAALGSSSQAACMLAAARKRCLRR